MCSLSASIFQSFTAFFGVCLLNVAADRRSVSGFHCHFKQLIIVICHFAHIFIFMERWLAAPLPFLVCYIIKVVQLVTLQVVDRIVIGNVPRIVIEFCKRHVSLIPLCNLVVKYHNKLCKILVVTFPLIKGTFESVFNGCDTKGICNREVLPKVVIGL